MRFSVKVVGDTARLVLDCDGVDVIAHELTGDVIRIGRALSNDVVIDDLTVSAQHALLTKSPRGYRLKDLGSTNGTQVNGASIADVELKDGAEIRFGCVTGVFWRAVVNIDNPRELQISDRHDSLDQIRVPETQSIFCPRTMER